MPAEIIPEHARAILTRDVPDAGLLAGDVGVVVHVHQGGAGDAPIGYMLELFSASGETIDVVSVPAEAVRPARGDDRLRVRVADVAAE